MTLVTPITVSSSKCSKWICRLKLGSLFCTLGGSLTPRACGYWNSWNGIKDISRELRQNTVCASGGNNWSYINAWIGLEAGTRLIDQIFSFSNRCSFNSSLQKKERQLLYTRTWVIPLHTSFFCNLMLFTDQRFYLWSINTLSCSQNGFPCIVVKEKSLLATCMKSINLSSRMPPMIP